MADKGMTGLDMAGFEQPPATRMDDRARVLRASVFTVVDWEVDARRLRVRRGTTERRVDPRVMDLLVELAAAAGAVVPRDDLMARVWRGAFVSENTVIQAVSRLRRVLDDTARTPQYIETITTVGYRLIATVNVSGGEAGHAAAARSTMSIPHMLPMAALAAAVIGLTWTLWPTATAEPRLAEARPLLTNPGRQPDPALSPDGESVAFVWQAPDRDGWDLYVQAVDGNQPSRLTQESGAWQFPAWTSDGQLAVLSGADGCAIHTTATTTLPVRKAVACPPGSTGLRWSPDGRQFIVSAPVANGRRLLLIDAARGTRRPLLAPGQPPAPVSDVSPAFSPDGRLVAFVRLHSSSHHVVMVAGVDGSGLRALTTDDWGHVRGLDWTPGADAVIHATDRSGAYRLWKTSLDGSTTRLLPIVDEWLVSPSVSRSRPRLIYRTFNDEIDLWAHTLDANGLAEPSGRLVASTRSEHEPALSPDGTRLAFISDRTGSMELWSADTDGARPVRHTHFDGPRPTMAAWSPGGDRLIFNADPDGQQDIFQVARDARQPVRLTSTPSAEINATFSRDGRRIYFASDRSGRWELWRMPVGGGEAEVVTSAGGFYGQEAPDGRHLYFVRLDTPGLWRMPVTGGVAEPLVTDYDFADWASWAVTDRGIYFTRHAVENGYPRPTIERFDPVTGSVEVVARPVKQIPYLSRSLAVSGDGRRMVVSLIERSDDEVLVVDLPVACC